MRAPDSSADVPAIVPTPETASGPKRRRWGRIAAVAVLVLLVATVVRFTVAPVSLPVTGMAERAIAARTGLEVSLGRIGLRLGVGRIELNLDDVRVRADAMAATVGRVRLVQSMDGRTVRVSRGALRIDPSGEKGSRDVPTPGEMVTSLGAAFEALRDGLADAGVRQVEVVDGRLDLIEAGRPIHEARVFQDVSANVAAGENLRVRARLIGAGGPISLRASSITGPEGQRVEIDLAGLVPRDLARVKPVQNGFQLDAALTAHLSPDGPPEAQVSLDIGGGTVIMGPRDPPRDFDGGHIELSLGADGRTISVGPARVEAGLSTVTVEGEIVAAGEPGAPWTFALIAPYVQFHSADIDKTPVELTLAEAEGRIDLAEGMLLVDRFVGQAPNGRADAVFALDIHEGKPWFSAAARIGPSSIDALLGAWPVIAAYQPRKAVASVVKGGTVRRGDVQIAFTPLEMDPEPTTHSDVEGTLAIDFDFVDTTFAVPELPVAITRGHGAFRMRDRTLSVRLDGGVIASGTYGDLRVVEGALTLPDLAEQPVTASISAVVEGPLQAVVALAERLDIEELDKLGITPEDVTGTVRARVAMRTPLADNVTMEDRQWSIDASLSGAGTKKPVSGRTFSDADVEVLVNSRRLAARGKAKVDGISVDVNYTEVFLGAKAGAARFVLTDRDRRERGFDTGEALTGPVVVTVEADEDGEQSFLVDLTQAALKLPGLAKASGQELTATGRFAGDQANMSVDQLKVEGSGVTVSGALALADGALSRAALDTIALSRGDRGSLNLRRDGGAYVVDLAASSFDARRLVRDVLGGGDGGGGSREKRSGSGPAVQAEAKIDRVRLSDETNATDVAITARYTGKELARLAVSGRIDGINAGSFGVRLAPGPGGVRNLQVDVHELGRLLSALDLYKRMRGGRTRLSAQIAADGSMVGRVIVEDFLLTDETTLEQIIERTRRRVESRGGRAALSVPEGNAMTFDRLEVDFVKQGDTVTIREAVLRGQVIGGTADGTIALGDKTLRLNGTLIPAYGVNNLFGRLPIVGEILGGGDQGGLIGVTFRFAGPLDKPKLTLNPLSAVAPGIFRKIFEYR